MTLCNLILKCRTQRVRPIIVDPGLYLSKKSDLALTTQRRSLPTAFKLFTGNVLVALCKVFLLWLGYQGYILGWLSTWYEK